MAEALGIGQMQISRLERRKDPRLSTIERTVAAMGGTLTMIATFPDQEPVVLVSTASLKGKMAAKTMESRPKKTLTRKRSREVSGTSRYVRAVMTPEAEVHP
jgi:hypothetical protein